MAAYWSSTPRFLTLSTPPGPFGEHLLTMIQDAHGTRVAVVSQADLQAVGDHWCAEPLPVTMELADSAPSTELVYPNDPKFLEHLQEHIRTQFPELVTEIRPAVPPGAATRHYAKVLALCASLSQEDVMARLVRHVSKGTCSFGCTLHHEDGVHVAAYTMYCPIGLGLADAASGINWTSGYGLPWMKGLVEDE